MFLQLKPQDTDSPEDPFRGPVHVSLIERNVMYIPVTALQNTVL